MKKILLPIDGSPRSLRTIQVVKQTFSPDDTELTILLVIASKAHLTPPPEDPEPSAQEEITETVDPQAEEESRLLLASFARMLPGYHVDIALRHGNPGPEIVRFAKEGTFDSILMTRSSRGPMQKLGSVATYIVRNASFITTTVLQEA